MNETAKGHSVLCHADPMILSADQAIPLGLLINETRAQRGQICVP
jgi:hypothetical protein